MGAVLVVTSTPDCASPELVTTPSFLRKRRSLLLQNRRLPRTSTRTNTTHRTSLMLSNEWGQGLFVEVMGFEPTASTLRT
jgi:hypothetical protein